MARPTEQYKADLNLWSQRHNGVRSEKRKTITLHTDESAYNYATKKFQRGWTAKRLAEHNSGGANPRSVDRGSYHMGVDSDRQVVRQVNDRGGTWSVGSRGNNESIHICMAGTTAYWTRAQWLAKPDLLDQTAIVVAHTAAFHGIPIRKIGPSEVASGKWGITHHDDWSKGVGGSDHWDVGPGFPWDHFINLVGQHHDRIMGTAPTTTTESEDEMTPEDRALLHENNRLLKDIMFQLGQPGGHPQGGDRTLYDLAASSAEKLGVPGTFDTLAGDEEGDRA